MNEEEKIEDQPTDNLQQSTENDNISERPTTNEQPSTENMEVHHHTHPGHHKSAGAELIKYLQNEYHLK